MKKIRVTYFALAAFAFAASCSKEAAEPNVFDWKDMRIHIKPSISNVSGSRAEEMTLVLLESFQVTCFNTAGDSESTDGYLSPYFENATFVRRPNETFESSPDEDERNWPSNSGTLRFFAFSPSLSEMGEPGTSLEGSETCYKLNDIRINPDISRQFDFITSEASGERWKDFSGGVELDFSHKFSQVELQAWGNSQEYDFDIAGVRIGNPVIEGTFVFADDTDPASAGRWNTDDEDAVKDKVEYIYRRAETSDKPYPGDRIFRINSNQHNSPESAGSIMGQGGCAMVIPTVNSKWEVPEDPKKVNLPYSTDRMYFSILMRVSDSESANVVYPYPGNPNGMTVISYAVDGNGNIIRRLYAGKSEGTYFMDPALTLPYEAAEGEEVMDFGWAAVPVDADWSAGKKYVYTLNYSEGIGVHDPSDPEPGKLIVGQTPIEWSVSVSDWNYAEKSEDYDPDLDVP